MRYSRSTQNTLGGTELLRMKLDYKESAEPVTTNIKPVAYRAKKIRNEGWKVIISEKQSLGRLFGIRWKENASKTSMNGTLTNIVRILKAKRGITLSIENDTGPSHKRLKGSRGKTQRLETTATKDQIGFF